MARSKEVEETLKQFGLPHPEAAPAPVIKGISRTRAPRQPLFPNTQVKLTKGKTKIQPGSLREEVIVTLRRRKGSATIEQLTALLKYDVKPVVIKLRDAGWVEVL